MSKGAPATSSRAAAEASRPLDIKALTSKILLNLRKRRDEAAARGELEAFTDWQREQLRFQQAVLDGKEPPIGSIPGHEAHRNALVALLSGNGAMALNAESQLAREDGDSPSVSELLTDWLKYQDRPPFTVKEMKRAVDRFIRLIGDKRIKAIVRRDVSDFSDKLREPGLLSPSGVSIPTTNTTLSLLSALLGFAVKRIVGLQAQLQISVRHRLPNPAGAVTLLADNRYRRRTLSG